MESSVGERFFEVLEREVKDLRNKEGNAINPTGTKEESKEEKMWFGEVYVYSFTNLWAAMDYLRLYYQDMSMEDKDSVFESRLEKFKERARRCPGDIAFELRGYICTFSEGDMILEVEKLKELSKMLGDWSYISLNSGDIQDKIYKFIQDYEKPVVEKVYNTNKNVWKKTVGCSVDEVVKYRVEQKLKRFRDVIVVCKSIMQNMYDSKWRN